MVEELTALERINTVLDGDVPDRVPTLCLGSDFKFMDLFMRSPYALTEEDLNFFDKAGLSPRFLHTQYLLAKFSPPSIYPNGLDAKVDLCWEIVDGIQPKKGEDPDTLLTANGQIFKFIINDEGTPSYWYTGPALNSKEKIKECWEHPEDFKVDKNRFKVLSKNRKKMKKFDIVVAQGFGGPFENCILGIGLSTFAKLARKEPEIIKKHLDFMWENYQKKNMKYLLRTKPDIVMIGNDIGYNDGLQLPLKQWQGFFKPILRRYVNMIHDAEIKVILHCCGAIEELFPDFIELKIDGVESLQPTINNLDRYKKKYPEITLLGTIDDTGLLVNGTPEEVRCDIQNKIKTLGKNGGYIPGPTNWLLDQKPENVIALYKAIIEFGAY
jgi:uroporphyrinogen decarboxylase